jgi:hypothetical protein
MKSYIVSYKRKGSNIALGFYIVKTTKNLALDSAKKTWKNDFYQGTKKAEMVILELDFYLEK